nr:hypothetical protein [Desulfobacteraceae bacterium]
MDERQRPGFAASRDRLMAVLITGAVLSLPVVLPGALGGIHSLIPLPVFYYLLRDGRRQGALIAAGGLLLTAALALALGTGPYLLVPLGLAPLGYVLAQAAYRNESPLRAGAAGVLFLLGLLLVLGLL